LKVNGNENECIVMFKLCHLPMNCRLIAMIKKTEIYLVGVVHSFNYAI